MRRILTGLVLILMLTGGAAAGPLQDGAAAYNRGDYATALLLWRPLAEQGDANAQLNLGLMYRKGLGVPQDDTEAVKWYQRAAEQGLAQAQILLCAMPQRDTITWCRLAAERGDPGAQNILGIMYATGTGGAPQDFVQAYMWFNLAAPRYPDAGKLLDQTAALMTPEQIAEAQKLAREWKPK